MHMVINSLIEVQGDKAEGEFSILAYHKTQSEEGPIDILTGGRNLDFFEKKHGIWKLNRARLFDLMYTWESGLKCLSNRIQKRIFHGKIT